MFVSMSKIRSDADTEVYPLAHCAMMPVKLVYGIRCPSIRQPHYNKFYKRHSNEPRRDQTLAPVSCFTTHTVMKINKKQNGKIHIL